MKYAAFIPLLVLAACGEPDVALKNASVEEVAKVAKAGASLNPGEWTNVTEVVSVDMPGLGADEKKMMSAMTQAMIGQKTETKNCITPEQAKSPDAGMFAGNASNGCRFETFTMSGGKMDAVMKCEGPDKKGEMKMTLSGQYGGDQYSMASEVNMSGNTGLPGHSGMTIKSKNSGKRIGACPAQSKG